MKPIIVGISGKARSGKDTFASVLVEEFGFKRFAFADPLKEFAKKYFKLSHEECYVTKTKYSRKILQGLGEMVRKEFDDRFWIRKLENDLDTFINNVGNPKVVITDIRYRNEYTAMRRWNYQTVELISIVRKNNPGIEYNPRHSSETDLDNIQSWGSIIHNDRGVEELKTTARNIAINRGWNR